jgi:hypothetical protein
MRVNVRQENYNPFPKSLAATLITVPGISRFNSSQVYRQSSPFISITANPFSIQSPVAENNENKYGFYFEILDSLYYDGITW